MNSRILVGVMCIGSKSDLRNMHFNRLKALTDKTLVLIDDHDYDIDADAIIKMNFKNGKPWNDQVNRGITSIMASDMGADWILILDSDEDLDYRLRSRSDMDIVINKAIDARANSVNFHLRELWNDKYHYRSDSVWGLKIRKRLFMNTLKMNPCRIEVDLSDKFHIDPLWTNHNHRLKGHMSEFEIYHYGCIDESRRIKRVEKYRQCDPGNKFSKFGYDYMLDYTGIEIKEVDGLGVSFLD